VRAIWASIIAFGVGAIVLLPLSILLSTVAERQRYASHYELPGDVFAFGDGSVGYAFPGDEVHIAIADSSTPFVYRALPPSESWMGRPEWIDEPFETWEPMMQADWFAPIREQGNHEVRVDNSRNCDFYRSGRYVGTGPCGFQSLPAEVTFHIADDITLVGKYLGVAVRTEESARIVQWRVSDPRPADVDSWLEPVAAVAGIGGFLLMIMGGFVFHWKTKQPAP